MAGAKTYLGRPWRDHAQTTFVSTEMSDVVRPAGWHNWDRPERERTSRYSESGNSGPGAAPAARVPWLKRLTPQDVEALQPVNVLRGTDGWEPSRVPSYASSRKAVDGID